MKEALIEAYVDSVVKRLDSKVREDIAKELHALIEDELQDPEKTVEQVLEGLGNPKKLAEEYGGKKRYFIGPIYYDFYIGILKIVLPAVWLAILIANVVAFIFNDDTTILKTLGGMYNATFYVFTYITVGFMLAEYFTNKNIEEKWTTKDLDVSKIKAKELSKGEAITGLVFLSILLVLFNVVPDVFAVISFGNEGSRVALLNMENYVSYLWMINASIGLAIVYQFLKLYFGKITKTYAIFSGIVNTIGTVFFILLIVSPNFYNGSLNQQLIDVGFAADVDYLALLLRIMRFVAIIAVLAWFVDTAKSLIYGFGIQGKISLHGGPKDEDCK